LPLPYYSQYCTKAGEAFTNSCGFDVEDFTVIYFIGLTSQQKEKMSLKATANFVIRNIGKLLSMSQLGG